MFSRIRRLDETVTQKITKIQKQPLNRVMILATYAGSGGFIWWVTLVIPMLITRKYRMTGVNLFLAFCVTYLLGEVIIKRAAGRSRPSAFIHEDDMMIKKPGDYSFPSGHTASSFTAFAVTAVCCPVWIWLPVLFGAMTIGFSRIYLRVHYLSDVVAGAVLGTGSGILCAVLFRRFAPLIVPFWY